MRVAPWLGLVLLFGACTPRVDQAAKASIDRQVAQLRPGDRQFGAPTQEAPPPLAAGQWVKQHVVDADGNHSIVTTKVLGVEGARTWLETETQTYSGNTAIKVLVSLSRRDDPSDFDVHAYWIKHANGRIEQLPPFLVDAMKPTLRTTLGTLVVKREVESQEDVTVPAGQFAQAFKTRVNLEVLGKKFASDTWWHPEVPINGGVRSVGLEPRSTTETIAFGTSGAKSVFP